MRSRPLRGDLARHGHVLIVDLCTTCLAVVAFGMAADGGDVQRRPGDGVRPAFGRYVVVDVRRAPEVAGPVGDRSAEELVGREAVFGDELLWIDGTECTAWTATDSMLNVDLDEPILSDLALRPVDSPASAGDARIGRAVQLACAGESIADLVVVDDRVLLTPSPSGRSFLVLERPLASTEVERLQLALRSMKFYAGDTTGRLDEETLRATADYAEYRGAAYRFHRTAVTSNLVDGMRVFDEQPRADEIKTVYGPGGVVAHFLGVVPVLAPRSSGVTRLAFSFADEDAPTPYTPPDEPSPADWTFELFSWEGTWVVLPAGPGGPYHVVAVETLPQYLAGDVAPERVIECDAPTSSWLPPAWRSDALLELPAQCCEGKERCLSALREPGRRAESVPVSGQRP